jgi:hypothetical protein
MLDANNLESLPPKSSDIEAGNNVQQDGPNNVTRPVVHMSQTTVARSYSDIAHAAALRSFGAFASGVVPALSGVIGSRMTGYGEGHELDISSAIGGGCTSLMVFIVLNLPETYRYSCISNILDMFGQDKIIGSYLLMIAASVAANALGATFYGLDQDEIKQAVLATLAGSPIVGAGAMGVAACGLMRSLSPS